MSTQGGSFLKPPVTSFWLMQDIHSGASITSKDLHVLLFADDFPMQRRCFDYLYFCQLCLGVIFTNIKYIFLEGLNLWQEMFKCEDTQSQMSSFNQKLSAQRSKYFYSTFAFVISSNFCSLPYLFLISTFGLLIQESLGKCHNGLGKYDIPKNGINSSVWARLSLTGHYGQLYRS